MTRHCVRLSATRSREEDESVILVTQFVGSRSLKRSHEMIDQSSPVETEDDQKKIPLHLFTIGFQKAGI
jgi:hypothetical protein